MTSAKPRPPLVPGEVRAYPVLPLRDIVVFPHMIVPLFVGREKSIRALEEVMKYYDGKTEAILRRYGPGPRVHYHAGVVDDFDGTFQRLHIAPGGHAITLHLEGYRTVTQNIYVTPDDTLKLQLAMDKLRPGEASDPVPIPARPLSPGGAPAAGLR